ncbi:MAG: hypothetical protein BRD29_00010 [Bacteroidetes bacterium QH_2_67_10]|nr:MAG: hypothetical protein BRD29_00010 [Bacteroidetes bacterium QH_2_67_10]
MYSVVFCPPLSQNCTPTVRTASSWPSPVSGLSSVEPEIGMFTIRQPLESAGTVTSKMNLSSSPSVAPLSSASSLTVIRMSISPEDCEASSKFK